MDLAAYYHDAEYGDIQSYYGAKGSPTSQWFEPFMRFDTPEFGYDLAMADLRFTENSFTFIGKGLDQGFYEGAPGLLLADIAMASLAMAFHTALAGVRLLVFYPVQVVFGGLWDLLSGKVSIGDYLKNVAAGAANILAGLGYAVGGAVRGFWTFGVSAINAVFRDPAKGLSGVAIGAAIGSIFGPVGTVVGGLIGGAVGGGGCFITTAVCEINGLPDDHEILQLLRSYRDGYLATKPGGTYLINEYYRVSPAIVAALSDRSDSRDVYQHLLNDYILPAVSKIRVGKYDDAFRFYRGMVHRAARLTGLTLSLDPKMAVPVVSDKVWRQ